MIQILKKLYRDLKQIAPLALLSLAITLSHSPAEARKLTNEEVGIVVSVNEYLNGFRDLMGNFVQVGPSGRYTSGRFFLSRPGRVRFEYEPPSPLMIVADGTWVSIENRRLKTSEHYPLRVTPLKIILAEKINLLRDAEIIQVFRDKSYITLTLQDKGSSKNGQITLVFQTENIALKEWIVVDGQGFETRITVSELVVGIKQSSRMFFIKKPDFPEPEN